MISDHAGIFLYYPGAGQAAVFPQKIKQTVSVLQGRNLQERGKGNMRLDKFLKVSRLIKRRTVANEACDAGRVMVNGVVAKASVKVKVGDVIEIQFGTKNVKVEVLDIQDTTKKEEAKELFRYL